MAFQEITSPPMLDGTGQEIVSILQQIYNKYDVEKSTLREVPFGVGVNDWVTSDDVYIATVSSAYVTTTSKEFTTFTATLRSSAKGDISVDKIHGGGGITLTTNVLPIGTINGTLYVIDADDGKVPILIEDTVVPVSNGGTGESTIAGAQDVLGITALSNSLADEASAITNVQTAIANVINPGGLSNNERYLAGNLGTVSAANVADFVSSYGLNTGNYKDIYPGCYIHIGDSVANTDWMVGGLGIKHNSGDTAMGHGAEFIPRGAGFAYGTQMNPTNTTEGGYKGSAMKTYLDGTVTPALQAVLGSHLLKQRVLITNAVDTAKTSQYSGYTGMASGWEWADAYAVLMSEVEVYGSMVWGGPFDVGEARTKLPVFNFISPVEFGRGSFWLRAVASSSGFAHCGDRGTAASGYASTAWLYVRPLIRIG